MKTYNTIDKSNWIRGEWDNEPDKAQWIDEATGLDCLIKRNMSGALCGYVGIPESHEHFGKSWDDGMGLEVHGGITFGDRCADNGNEAKDICHAGTVANETVWWLGFDCAHSGDYCPAHSEIGGDLFLPKFWEKYRNLEYVKAEVKDLALQLN